MRHDMFLALVVFLGTRRETYATCEGVHYKECIDETLKYKEVLSNGALKNLIL